MSINLLNHRLFKRFAIQTVVSGGALGIFAYSLLPGGDGGGLQLESVAAAQEAAERDVVDVTTYYAMERLRNEVVLTQRDLRAAGCDAAATKETLTHLLRWYEANKISLYRARNAVLEARKNLNQAAHLGGKLDERKLASLSEAVAQALVALEGVHTQAAVAAELSLTQTQRERLSAARANRNLPSELRYVPGLSDEQRQRIRAAIEGGASRADVLAAARLSASQQQAVAAIESDMKERSLEVAAGEALALPMPQEVLEELNARLQEEEPPAEDR